ncbi:Csu type fimbrial protein [Enterobacter asburiae]|uniref:Csu type fimbrial protein n=1 Tax=Enterobacter asburiae TaxID=61645 RepID=UPI0021CF22F2|nr:spore coat U domain-containing protein [Enterobacter asburiae]MCU6243788.1 spore coat U domain-containing protein [Enterobacter asburiae]
MLLIFLSHVIKSGNTLIKIIIYISLLTISPEVYANAQCWINGAMNIDFGPVDTRADDYIHSNLNYTCQAPYDPTGDLYHVRACVFVQPDEIGTSGPRSLRRWDNTILQYNLYSDAARIQQVGPLNSDMPSYSWSIDISSNSQYSSQLTLYGKVPGRQPGLSSGTYESHYNGGIVRWRWSKGNMPTPTVADCQSNTGGIGGGSVTFFLNVTANVLDSCLIQSASDLDFGQVDSQSAQNIDQSATITLNCPQGTAWSLALNSGENPTGTQRRMINNKGEVIPYSLFRDPARTLSWEPGTQVSGTGTGQTRPVNVPVYGRVPKQSSLPAGSFRDNVIIMLTY